MVRRRRKVGSGLWCERTTRAADVTHRARRTDDEVDDEEEDPPAAVAARVRRPLAVALAVPRRCSALGCLLRHGDGAEWAREYHLRLVPQGTVRQLTYELRHVS